MRRQIGNVTVQDVAREAGVSAMTVSRVINGGANVRQDTQRAVMAAVEKLNYRPNVAARSLAAGKPVQIGLLYANPSDAYLSRFLIGALEGARAAGCHVVLEPCETLDADALAEAARQFVGAQVRGVILPPPLSESVALQAELADADIPFVTIARGEGQGGGCNVRIDDFAAAHEMTRHLLAQGHVDIAFIKGHPNQRASAERLRGFLAAMEQAGCDVSALPVEQGFFTYRSGVEAAARLLAAERRPTAIFAANDDMAAAAIGVAHRNGLDVPRDLSIVGFDDTGSATAVWPELTTIRQPIADMARAAIAMLVRQVGGADSSAPPEEVLPFELIVRGSAAAAPR